MGSTSHATDTGGFLLGYRYHFNRWLAADASYATPGTRNRTSLPPASSVCKLSAPGHGALVVTAPHRIFRLAPYASPYRCPRVDPTVMQADLFPEHRVSRKLRLSTEAAPTTPQQATSHFAPNTVSFVYGRPDFDLAALHSGTTTHTAQPPRYRLSLLKQPYRDCRGTRVTSTREPDRGKSGPGHNHGTVVSEAKTIPAEGWAVCVVVPECSAARSKSGRP